MLIAYTAEIQGKSVLFNSSDGRTLTADNWFDAVSFLLYPCDMAVTWNVDRFAEAFMALIPSAITKQLKNKGRVFLENGEKLYYQFGRVFAITYGRETNIYPLHKYSDTEITDAKELEQLANKVIEAYKVFGIEPKQLNSPVSTYSLDKVDYPRACDLPDSAFPMLDKCDNKKWVEWREVFKLGHWNANEVADYDLQSAYPSLIARLPDICGAKFFESDEMLDDTEYSWGELEGVLKVTSDITPFGYIGEQPEQITTEHLWLINKYELGTFQMKHGWFFKLPQYYKLPFKETMQELYKARQNDNPLVKTIAKAISVGIGGKFAQRYDNGELGADYNSIYSRIITSRCSIKVADMIWRNGLQDDVISVLVDGFLVESSGVGVAGGNVGMGNWRVNSPSSFLVASLLYQWGAEKHPNGKYYNEMIEQIRAKPNSSVYDDIDLNLITHDRQFVEQPRTGKELLSKHYTSTP